MAKKPDIWDFLLILGGAFIGLRAFEAITKPREYPCPRCSKAINDGADWCPHCGAPIKWTSPAR